MSVLPTVLPTAVHLASVLASAGFRPPKTHSRIEDHPRPAPRITRELMPAQAPVTTGRRTRSCLQTQEDSDDQSQSAAQGVPATTIT